MNDIVGYIILSVLGLVVVSLLAIAIVGYLQEQKDLSKCRRGIVKASIDATNIFTGRTRDYSSGHFEVWILEETASMYKVRWMNDKFEMSSGIPKWILKSECKVIEEGKNE